jgi:hypothetical protein
MKFQSFLFAAIAFCGTGYGAESVTKPQTAMEFYHLNPNHPLYKLLKKFFKEVKPCSKVSRVWRLITGKGMFLPGDHLRHYLYLCVEDMAKELNWTKEKIVQEVSA